ncbi:hypothetical protein QCA50_000580 [Cerrena zonata]|uniref:Diphthine--ammonia ligase n=1 Tax=Cerrena zonata TaxID=2478898 RepID=A0AAW0H054_9APHY
MKYVALLSGGKDSCYNLLHCSRNGHELVAAASLRPEQGKDEIDSYMYQTVGQDAIQFVAEALDVPLYRRTIKGTAVNMGAEYGARQASKNIGISGDETEDLYELLHTVKASHPDIQAVSVGAILSNYQRIRVEHVCRRLALTPLCYLWQRDQRQLLSEMIEAGLEAILIKVAGMGLTTKHLGKTLAQMQPTLLKLNDMYDLHPCGEGGEYETLTLDCPLFKKRISLENVETVIHSDHAFATVAYLRVKSATLVSKNEPSSGEPPVPDMLEDSTLQLQQDVERFTTPTPIKIRDVILSHKIPYLTACSAKAGRWVTVSNVQRSLTAETVEISVSDEVQQCFQIIQDLLAQHNLDFSHIANVNIFLSSMDLFSAVNEKYMTFFGSGPPARACVAVDLPSPIRVRIECVAYAEESERDRQILHVQGLSYWAPANIGPYSQAVVINEQTIFMSGQIGLIPRNLTLPSPPSLATETALASQHVERVTRALCDTGKWKPHSQLTLYWLQNAADIPAVRHASATLKDAKSPTLFVVVASLPKGSLVEKQVLLHTGRFEVLDEDGDKELKVLAPKVETGYFTDDKFFASWEVSRFSIKALSSTLLCFRGPLDKGALDTYLPGLLDGPVISIRLFYVKTESLPPILTQIDEKLPITTIPCRQISTRSSDNWDYAMCIIRE